MTLDGRYIINGEDLYTEYGVTVLKSEGEIDIPKPKERQKVSWPDDHGEDVYTDETFYGPREITLECMIRFKSGTLGQSRIGAIRALRAFQDTITTSGLKMLISFKSDALPHMVYVEDFGKVVSYHSGNDTVTLLFKVKLIEPIPAGKSYSMNVVNKNTDKPIINAETDYALEVYWGDGSHTQILGLVEDFSHTYAANGIYTIAVLGAVEKASSYEMTATTPSLIDEIG